MLFQSTTAYKIDSEHTGDYTKLFVVCKVEILQVTVNKCEVLSYIRDQVRGQLGRNSRPRAEISP